MPKKEKYYRVRVKVTKPNSVEGDKVVRYKPAFFNIVVVAFNPSDSAERATEVVESFMKDDNVMMQVQKNENLRVDATSLSSKVSEYRKKNENRKSEKK